MTTPLDPDLERFARDDEDFSQERPCTCPHCQGRGWIAVELGSSLRYTCTDCGGSGRLEPQEPEQELDDDDD